MTPWIFGVVLAVVAWGFGVRRGKRSRESEIELSYRLGVADGLRRDPYRSSPLPPADSERRLIAEATAEAAIVVSSAIAWIAERDDPG